MRRLPFLTLLMLAASAWARADIVDVRELGDGDQPDVFIAFGSAPGVLASGIVDGVIEIEIDQAIHQPRRIDPRRSRWIRSIETMPSEHGQIVRLEPAGPADNIELSRTRSGLRLSWTPAATVSPEPDVRAATRVPDSGPAESGSPPSIVADAQEAADPESGDNRNEDGETDVMAAADTPSENNGDCAAAAAAVEADSWNIDALTIHARCELDNGNAMAAIPLLERVIAFEPGRFDAVLALAEAQEMRGNLETARALYEQAATVAATDGQAVAARARARRLTN